MIRSCTLVTLLFTALIAAAPADDIQMPEELADFWGRYHPARLEDDEEEMDRTVRLKQEQAEMALEVLLDDLARVDDYEIVQEARVLAWSLDRIVGSERFITRVRLTLDQDIMERRQRLRAKDRFYDLQDEVIEATKRRDLGALGEIADGYVEVFAQFDEMGEGEYAFLSLLEAAKLQELRGLPWEQSLVLKRAVDVGKALPFRLDLVRQAEGALEALIAKGIDPDKPKPEEVPEGEEAKLGPGIGLESFADGSDWITVELESVTPRKGITGVTLPTFHPIDNFFLWPATWIDGNGPADFDTSKVIFRPRDQTWTLTRDGSTFIIDPTGDGSLATEFTPSATPSLVEIPLSDKRGDTLPLMVSVPSDRELMFGIEVNYSPQLTGARLRYNLGGFREGEALDSTWKIFDTNLSGRYGDTWEYIDDLITHVDDELPLNYVEVDAVQIGKAKVATPWSTVLPVGETFYRTKIDQDGTKLELREMALATGEVKLSLDAKIKPTHVVIQAVGEDLKGAFFDIVPAKRGKGVRVPVGTYKLAMGRLETGKKNSMRQVRIYPGTFGEFTVEEGQTKELEFGAPYSLTVFSRPDGDEVYVDGRSIRVFGKSGEEYACLFDEALVPEASIVDSKGKTVVKPDKMLQADISAWQNNDRRRDNVLWFPLDVRLEKPRVSDYEIHLFQKAHRMLGGPLESKHD